MHYRGEIVIPPVDNVEEFINEMLEPWNEKYKYMETATSDKQNPYAFFDYFVVGGRYNGDKVLDSLPENGRERFYKRLNAEHVTVSGIQFGKQTLQPTSQKSLVDSIWCEMFPDNILKECPLFDNYKGNMWDIMPLANIPQQTEAYYVIIAKADVSKPNVSHIFQKEVWNGKDWLECKFDGCVTTALEMVNKKLDHLDETARAAFLPNEKWLCVTVDFHS